MDEPTNHLDIESIIWLQQYLKSHDGALLMTSHDREFMNRVVSKIAEIDGGEIITYSGNYDFYERERAIRETSQPAAFAPFLDLTSSTSPVRPARATELLVVPKSIPMAVGSILQDRSKQVTNPRASSDEPRRTHERAFRTFGGGFTESAGIGNARWTQSAPPGCNREQQK